ncbi:glutathione S-transferase family protein [Aliikangiella maris]|uniref:Glutathione S-transferase family protein n=2 Tax=Aliikangiella maris TaxID=3162458 RepID=A0ABV2BY64_9GAMM
MKIYEFKAFPHPRRVRMFLAEKNIDVAFEQINVPAGEHRTEAYLAKNPSAAVPLLELDNGNFISETVAICRYFEALQPEPALMGTTPEEQATIEMWQRKMDNSLMITVSHYFHHATEGLGELEIYQNHNWGEQNKAWANKGLEQLNQQLQTNSFVAGNSFSIADITALCAVDFALYLNLFSLSAFPAIDRWYQAVNQRPSASA